MTRQTDDEAPASYASPPCFMHELDPAYMGLSEDAQRTERDVARWRKAERERLIAARLAIPARERDAFSKRIADRLDMVIGSMDGLVVSTYWPFRGEPDLRPWMERVVSAGGICALPVVVAPRQPLIFRGWKQGEPLERGVWNIPIPAAGTEVTPDIVIAPLIGFDPGCYRLGYGGGFYDRTLAAQTRKPRIVGIGYTNAAIPTIYPQPHDIPMDVVVTERDVRYPGESAPQG